MGITNWLKPATSTQPALNKIPPYRKELLYISHEDPSRRGHGFGLQFTITVSDKGGAVEQDIPDDPSTIYSMLPATLASSPGDIGHLGYFPSYSGMTDEQRGRYLGWLCDVTAPVDIGYVFVYYYGLERQLLGDKFEQAFDEVVLLRKHHDHGSFQGYSASALVHACLLNKRIDKLQHLYEAGFDYFENSNLLLLHQNKLDLFPDMVLKLGKVMPGVNRKYLRLDPVPYERMITEALTEQYGAPSYPLYKRVKLEEVEGIPYPVFANISFPSELRAPPLPNIIRHPPFRAEMNAIFKAADKKVKDATKSPKRKAK